MPSIRQAIRNTFLDIVSALPELPKVLADDHGDAKLIEFATFLEFRGQIDYATIQELCTHNASNFWPRLFFSCSEKHGGVGMLRNQVLKCIRCANHGAAAHSSSFSWRSEPWQYDRLGDGERCTAGITCWTSSPLSSTRPQKGASNAGRPVPSGTLYHYYTGGGSWRVSAPQEGRRGSLVAQRGALEPHQSRDQTNSSSRTRCVARVGLKFACVASMGETKSQSVDMFARVYGCPGHGGESGRVRERGGDVTVITKLDLPEDDEDGDPQRALQSLTSGQQGPDGLLRGHAYSRLSSLWESCTSESFRGA
ncbi:hypothetical protein MAPG_00395 [Magnaporthiopsis poae ATCC 64411]|uniref:Uncharacterized protein n=1 Tax=Magnaporthiopsis poae (strain ATCC 64411 / 73-15) TaxID=644358 RepID=A0A0C4DKW3_MAGP6|nr:hypothetical protein MAPG_00395 [Magnaporthiopsis poae ATCC 64411]